MQIMFIEKDGKTEVRILGRITKKKMEEILFTDPFMNRDGITFLPGFKGLPKLTRVQFPISMAHSSGFVEKVLFKIWKSEQK